MKGLELHWSPDLETVLVYDHVRRTTLFYGTAHEFASWALVEKYGDAVTHTINAGLQSVTKAGATVMSENEAELLCNIRRGDPE